MTFTKKNPDALAGASGVDGTVLAYLNGRELHICHGEIFQVISSLLGGIFSSLGVAVDLRAIAFALRQIAHKGSRQ